MIIPGLNVVGKYHSRPDEPAELSKDDISYISSRSNDIYKNEGLLLESQRWLEIVLRISKKDYVHQVNSSWPYSDYVRKARCVVRIPANKDPDFTFGAFWIYQDKNKMRKKKLMSISCGPCLDTGLKQY